MKLLTPMCRVSPRPLDLVQGAECLEQRDRRVGPVEQEQIGLGAKPAQALVDRALKVARAEAGWSDLGRQPDLGPGHRRAADRLADAGLVAIALRGIDMAVADLERMAHDPSRNALSEAGRTQSQRRNLHVPDRHNSPLDHLRPQSLRSPEFLPDLPITHRLAKAVSHFPARDAAAPEMDVGRRGSRLDAALSGMGPSHRASAHFQPARRGADATLASTARVDMMPP